MTDTETVGDPARVQPSRANGRDPYSGTRPVDENVRCRYCHAKLAMFVGRPWRFRCRKCSAITQSPDAEDYRPAPVQTQPSKGRYGPRGSA